MFISKFIIYYIILYFTYKIIKAKILKEKIKLENCFCNKIIIEESNNKNEYALIPYKHKKKSKITLQEVYDNFFKNKKTKVENNIDLTLINNIKKTKKDNIILNDSKENINLYTPDNFLIYNFNSNKNYSYKIKCKLFINNCSNIRLIISDSKKRFIYDYNKENNNNDYITEYGFILDNFFDFDEIISIYLLFDKKESDSAIIINSLFLEIIEKSLKKEDSLIIFDVNNKYIPFYTNVENILDYIEYVDDSNVFFF